ncbi:glycosyltransferase [Qipengyuania sp. 1XM1-15A]|uniref:glycosyltransferase n=1 Tax=Qipengyuania xiamenensis TaxID=2867237 RepID=UPI001C873688|nr:glycosyltransferase [Qipengyuania xiamenensis]MBX7531962.1 glycosyltransferase [Qipengyuania xiamenensis]
MKILHVITGLNVGGAENMLAKLIEKDPRPQTQHVLSLLKPGPLAERITATGATVHTLGMERGLPTIAAARRLTKLVREIGPDVLHGWMYHGNLAVTYAQFANRSAIPTIWNIRHSLEDARRETLRTRALLAISRRLSHRPSAIVYNSAASAAQHEAYGFSAAQRIVIPNGFDCSLFRPDPEASEKVEALFGIPPGRPVMGCIARLHPMKGHANLLAAATIAMQRGSDFHLLMVGHGLAEPPNDLQELIANLPSGRVTTCDARLDVAEWLPGIDILAVPSGWGEAFPNVIGEALSCGVPVISTDVGDSSAIVGPAGEIVSPEDPETLAGAISRMLELSRDERSRLGLAGRDRVVDNYSLDAITQRYEDLYREVSSKRGNRAPNPNRQEHPVGKSNTLS